MGLQLKVTFIKIHTLKAIDCNSLGLKSYVIEI